MSVKYCITLIAILALNAINATHHHLNVQTFSPVFRTHSAPVETAFQTSHFPGTVFVSNVRTQPFVRTFEAPVVSTPIQLPQTIPQYLLSLRQTPDVQVMQTIPKHLLTLAPTQTVAAPVSQPLVQSLSQPLLTRTQLLSPAHRTRAQVVQNVVPIVQSAEPLSQNVEPIVQRIEQTVENVEPIVQKAEPLLTVPESSQLPIQSTFHTESVSTVTSNSGPQNQQTVVNTPFVTPTKPLNFAPNLPEVHKTEQLSQTITETNEPFKSAQTSPQVHNSQVIVKHDIPLTTSDLLSTETLVQNPTSQTVPEVTLSQPIITQTFQEVTLPQLTTQTLTQSPTTGTVKEEQQTPSVVVNK